MAGDQTAAQIINYEAAISKKDFSLGRIGLGYDPGVGGLFISSTANMNGFGKALGYKEGDVFKSLNGVELPANPGELQGFLDFSVAVVEYG